MSRKVPKKSTHIHPFTCIHLTPAPHRLLVSITVGFDWRPFAVTSSTSLRRRDVILMIMSYSKWRPGEHSSSVRGEEFRFFSHSVSAKICRKDAMVKSHYLPDGTSAQTSTARSISSTISTNRQHGLIRETGKQGTAKGMRVKAPSG